MKKLYKRTCRSISRKWCARCLGVHFGRARSFVVPQQIRIAGTWFDLIAPVENGVRVAFVDVLLDDCYRVQSLKKCGVTRVLDIGANVGFFSLAVRHTFPSATIHAYEPNPRLIADCKNQLTAIGGELFNEAVGGTEGFVEMNDSGDSVQATTREIQLGSIRQVSLGTAIERIGGSVGLVKLDCEGAEWEILADSKPWECVQHLAMEYHLWAGDYEHADAVSRVHRLGFTIRSHQILHDNYGLIVASRLSAAQQPFGPIGN